MLDDKGVLRMRTVCGKCERSCVRILVEPPLIIDADAKARQQRVTVSKVAQHLRERSHTSFVQDVLDDDAAEPEPGHAVYERRACTACGNPAVRTIDNRDGAQRAAGLGFTRLPVCASPNCEATLRGMR